MNELLRTRGLNWVEFFSWTSVRESYEYTLYYIYFRVTWLLIIHILQPCSEALCAYSFPLGYQMNTN